jgi:hypothetical protein
VTDKDTIGAMKRVAAMATMASRLETFRKVLPVIHAQVDHVFIYLDGYTAFPKFLENFDRVTVYKAEDVGNLHCSSRFLCLQELNAPAVVAMVDDDIIYPPNYIDRLVGELKECDGNAIVGVHGRIFVPPHKSYVRDAVVYHFAKELPRSRHVHAVGVGTCAFVASNFPVNPREWGRTDMDDINVAIEAQRRGLPRTAIARADGWMKPHPEPQADSIWNKMRADDSEQSRLMRTLLALHG